MEAARRKKLHGKVVSTKMEKTINVNVESYRKHPKYGKRILHSKNFLAHDEKGEAKLNDIVEIIECRPLSRRKSFRLVRVIERGVESDTTTN